MWKKYSESLHRKIKTVKLPEAAVTLLSTYAPAGKQRPWRITRPTRVGATPEKESPFNSGWGVLPYQPKARTVRKNEGL